MTKNTFSILRYTAVLMLVGSLFILGGCSDDDEAKPTKTVYELISENPELSSVKEQIDLDVNASLKASLQGSTDVTFFAPSNTAMNNLLTTLGLTNFASISPTTVQAVLNYHLVESLKLSSDLTNGAELTTKETEKIKIIVTSTGEKKLDTGATSDAAITTADTRATNGALHIVDVVLVPPTIGALIVQTLGKVAQPILLSSSFSILASAILKADAGKAAAETIVGAMIASPALTVFAPVNDVFKAANITVDTYSAAQWNAIIRGHVIAKTLTTLPSGEETTINGKVVTLTSSTVKGLGNTAAVNVVVTSKVSASNGIVYPIAGVILNP